MALRTAWTVDAFLETARSVGLPIRYCEDLLPAIMPNLRYDIGQFVPAVHTHPGENQEPAAEFVHGKISREQFNILYEHCDVQLSPANGASAAKQAGGMSTFAVRTATEGKVVYYHRSGTFIETLGDFDAPPKEITPILSELSLKLETHEFIEPSIGSIGKGLWLMVASREYTTVMTMFGNEPSPQQVKEIVRLHHDFQEANKRLLGANMINANKLAVPFLSFVQKSSAGTV